MPDNEIEENYSDLGMTEYQALPTHEGAPYLSAALLCERAIEDREGIFTLVRLFDEMNLTIPEEVPGPTAEQPFPLRLSFFVGLKSVDTVAWESFQIRIVAPSGRMMDPPDSGIRPVPGKSNLNIHVSFMVGIASTGVFWFEVVFNRRLMTRIPMLVHLHRVPREQFGFSP